MRVLVVDDEADIRDLVSMTLQREGFDVVCARDGADAIDQARARMPELIVLDLMLPKVDGFDVCRTLRAEANVPILMLTARADDVDKVVGLESGADDYLTKPFNPRELIARVRAVMRRAERAPRSQTVLRAGRLELDRDRREARLAGEAITLRAKEFDLLAAFLEHEGIVLTRDRLLEIVWGYEIAGTTRTVDVHVNHLRAKLGGSGVTIETLRGVGYKLVARQE